MSLQSFTCKLLNEFHDGIFRQKRDKISNFRLIMSTPYLDVAALATIRSGKKKLKINEQNI